MLAAVRGRSRFCDFYSRDCHDVIDERLVRALLIDTRTDESRNTASVASERRAFTEAQQHLCQGRSRWPRRRRVAAIYSHGREIAAMGRLQRAAGACL
jgi:hypothetical protein